MLEEHEHKLTQAKEIESGDIKQLKDNVGVRARVRRRGGGEVREREGKDTKGEKEREAGDTQR